MNSFFKDLKSKIPNKLLTLESVITAVIALFLLFASFSFNSGNEIRSRSNLSASNSTYDGMGASFEESMVARSVIPMQKQMLAEVSDQIFSNSSIASDFIDNTPKRRMQETHSIEMLGPNNNIKSFYEYATKLCSDDVCYINNGNISINDSQSVGSLNLKIKHGKLEYYLNSLLSNHNSLEIISRSRSAQDRTSQYEDIKARKNSQEALRGRLINLVANYKGEKIQSLLEIERELARVQGQIESMDAQLRSILDVTDMTTVNLIIRGKVEYAPPKQISPIMTAFNKSSVIIQNSTASIITLTAGVIPWLGLLLAIFVSIKITRKIIRVVTKTLP